MQRPFSMSQLHGFNKRNDRGLLADIQSDLTSILGVVLVLSVLMFVVRDTPNANMVTSAFSTLGDYSLLILLFIAFILVVQSYKSDQMQKQKEFSDAMHYTNKPTYYDRYDVAALDARDAKRFGNGKNLITTVIQLSLGLLFFQVAVQLIQIPSHDVFSLVTKLTLLSVFGFIVFQVS